MSTKVPNNLLNASVKISGAQDPQILLYTNNGNANSRNFAITCNEANFGDFLIMQSTTNVGNPIAGNARIAMDVNGNVVLGLQSPSSAVSLFELSSTTKGFLPPRMTTAQRDAISSPPAGLTIYNSDNGNLEVFSTVAGVGYSSQTWQNVTGTRAIGTTYTNSTSAPIGVAIKFTWSSNATSYYEITVAGVVTAGHAQPSVGTDPVWFYTTVPVGASYSINFVSGTATGVLSKWSELR